MGKSIITSATSSAGLLALVAVLIHALGSTGSERRASPDDSQQPMPGLSIPAAGDKAEQHPVRWQGPWIATQQYFHSAPTVAKADFDACSPNPADACSQAQLLNLYAFPKNANLKDLHSIIATVPDPLHTRMAMETDRYLDSIQQAAFDSGYELASQWLPWTVKAAAEKADSDDASSHLLDWEKLPGLLVFRPHFTPYLKDLDSLLLIFVVGETPTAGLNGFQFEIARRTIAGLDAASPHRFYIAGPNFSGSFLSLTRLLEESPAADRVELSSAAASNSEYARAMLIDLKQKGFLIDSTAEGHPSVSFHSSTVPSVSFHTDFLRLAAKLDLRTNQLAQIMEDETGFSFTVRSPAAKVGAASEDPSDAIVTYRYPRNIAQLRNSYNDAAFAAPQSDTKGTPPVDFSLKDTQSGEDDFPTFSTSHTPISQNAILQQIADNLRHSSIRLVSLSATNIFDTLFLANVLTRKCPDTRIVLQGADLLFVEEASAGSLSGLMAISPFPLFSESSEISRRGTSRRVPLDVTTFATSDQIAAFKSVSSLLSVFATDQNRGDRQNLRVASEDNLSSAWLLVLSPRGWMPVDLFSQANRTLDLNGQRAPWFGQSQASSRSQQRLAALLSIGSGWISLCALIAAFSLAFIGRLVYLLAHPRQRVWSSLCLSDLSTRQRRHAMGDIVHGRYFCMISAFASMSAVNGVLLCPMLVCLAKSGSPASMRDVTVVAIVSVAFALSAITAISLAVVVPVRICKAEPFGVCPPQTPVSFWSIALRLLVLTLAFGTVYVWWTCCDNGVAGYMLCFRTLTLASPVSPVLPLLLASSGLFALSYFHLLRFTWGDRRQPYLDTSIFNDLLRNEFKGLKDRLECLMTSTFGTKSRGELLALFSTAALFIGTLLILLPAGSLSSFEPLRFSRLLRLLLLLLAFYTTVTLVRFTRSWKLFRAFLVNLNSVVLGRYLTHISEFGGKGPVWIREVKLMSLSTSVNGAIALHNLELMQKTPGAYNSYRQALKDFLSPEESQKTNRLDFILSYEKFRWMASQTAEVLGANILIKYWKNNELPFVAEATSETEPAATNTVEAKTMTAAMGGTHPVSLEARSSPVPMVSAPAPQDETPSLSAYEQASKYVALLYSVYIGYVLHQLQNLLLCSVVCFVLLVLALNSFTFQAPQAIFHLASAGLVLGGAAILMAFAQMERDPVLSRLSGTPEGELGKDFYVRAATYGALPLLAVLSTEFPAISRYVTTWIQPLSAALR